MSFEQKELSKKHNNGQILVMFLATCQKKERRQAENLRKLHSFTIVPSHHSSTKFGYMYSHHSSRQIFTINRDGNCIAPCIEQVCRLMSKIFLCCLANNGLRLATNFPSLAGVSPCLQRKMLASSPPSPLPQSTYANAISFINCTQHCSQCHHEGKDSFILCHQYLQ